MSAGGGKRGGRRQKPRPLTDEGRAALAALADTAAALKAAEDARKAQIAAALEAGATYQQIISAGGCSATTVADVARSAVGTDSETAG